MKKEHLRKITEPKEKESLFNYNNTTRKFELNGVFIVVPKKLITDTPNDQELGSIVRQMANE